MGFTRWHWEETPLSLVSQVKHLFSLSGRVLEEEDLGQAGHTLYMEVLWGWADVAVGWQEVLELPCSQLLKALVCRIKPIEGLATTLTRESGDEPAGN